MSEHRVHGPWTLADLHQALSKYEAELQDAGLKRNTVTTYVQHPERFLSWLEGRYAPRHRGESTPTRSSSKYDPLTRYLSARTEARLQMSFEDVEAVLGFDLPASARRHRAWWANERVGSHSHANSWLDAGRTTERVDLNAGTVVFVGSPRPVHDPHGFIGSAQSDEVRGRDADELLKSHAFGH